MENENIMTTTLVVEVAPYRELRKILIDRGISFAEWVRSKIDEELKEEAGIPSGD